jgi:hypothetical protein
MQSAAEFNWELLLGEAAAKKEKNCLNPFRKYFWKGFI